MARMKGKAKGTGKGRIDRIVRASSSREALSRARTAGLEAGLTRHDEQEWAQVDGVRDCGRREREEKEHREEIWRRQFGWRCREDKIGQPNNERLSSKRRERARDPRRAQKGQGRPKV